MKTDLHKVVKVLKHLTTKLASSSISTKIISGILAAALILGSGVVISNLIKNQTQAVSQNENQMLIQNSKWEKLLGKTKDDVIDTDKLNEEDITAPEASNPSVNVPIETIKPAATEKTSETDWRQAYAEYITKDLYADYPKLWYSFIDMDGNGILELFTLINTAQFQIDDGRAPSYEHGAEITMHWYNGSKVLPVDTFYFGNSEGRFVIDFENNMVWHDSFNMSQGNIEEITGYTFSNGVLTAEKSVSYDSTTFAYNGGVDESDIIYEPNEHEYEKVYKSLNQFEGINWYYVTDDVLQAIKSYEEYFN